MSGAPITFTLYRNGIHITYALPEFITCPELEREMARAFDAREDVEQSLWNGPLAPLGGLVQPAIDSFTAQDRRGETFADTPVPMGLSRGKLHAGKKR